MADELQRVTRRAAIRSTAVAAGLVWSTPVVRSVGNLGTVGTPAPPTSDTEPPVTHYTFAGTITRRSINVQPCQSQCAAFADVFFGAELSVFGTTGGELFLILQEFGPLVDVTGELVFLGPSTGPTGHSIRGTATGTISQSQIPNTFLEDIHLDITITGGTGDFAGAIGSAVYDHRHTLVGEPPNESVVFSGELSGSFDVPG